MDPLHHEMVPNIYYSNHSTMAGGATLKVIRLARFLHVCESMILFVAKFHKCVTRCI